MILKYLRPVIEDESGQPSRKRILEILCVSNGCVLTTITCIWKFYNPDLDVPTLTMLIAPLFVTGTAYSGITSYYQNKLQNGIQLKSDNSGNTDAGTINIGITN